MQTYLITSINENFNHEDFANFSAGLSRDITLPNYIQKYNIDIKSYYFILYKEKLLTEYLNSVSNCKVILYGPIEPILEVSIDFLKRITNILEKNNVVLEIWIGNWDNNYNKILENIHLNIKIINWNRLVQYLSYNVYANASEYKQAYDRLFVNLNNKQRYHRCCLIEKLAEHNLLDNGYVSWLKKEDIDTVSNFDFKHFDNKKLIVDTDDILSNHPVVPIQKFNKGFIHVFGEYTETEIPVIDISEKTWLSILYEKPFLAVAAAGYYKTLSDAGYLLYDEIFDYGFDSSACLHTRIEGIIANLDKLKKTNLSNLNTLIESKLRYNKTHFLNQLQQPDHLLNLWYSYTVQDKETNFIISKFKYNQKRGLTL